MITNLTKRSIAIVPLLLGLVGQGAGCGAPEQLQVPSQDISRQQEELSLLDFFWRKPKEEAFVADFTASSLDAQAWSKRINNCSPVRNACVDDGDDLTQLSDGKLVLSATAATAATSTAPRVPSRYPSLDLIDPLAQLEAGRCMEVDLVLPSGAQSYGGIVLAPQPGAMFTGQIYLVSATAGSVRMGVACAGAGGTITFSRPADETFLRAKHSVRFCATTEGVSWHMDDVLWGEVAAEELSEQCGEWPFGDVSSPLQPHFVVAPQVNFAGTSPAASMVISRLSVQHAQ